MTQKFSPPKTDDKVVDALKAGVPFKTQKDTKWCCSIWEEWRRYRNKTTDTLIAPKLQLNYWLSQFILEVYKEEGI